MPNIFKILSSALKVGSERADVITQNLANLSTPGFKKVITALRSNQSGELALETGLDFTPGQEMETSNAQYFRIKERGFFQAQNSDGGIELVRSGQFSVDNNGKLCLNNLPVVWKSGKNTIIQKDQPFVVEPNGSVNQNGQEIGQLSVVDFNPSQIMVSRGGNYRAEGKGESVAATLVNAEEASNQDPIMGMASLLENFRYFELCQKALLSEDKIMEKSISDLGRTR